MGLTVDSSTTEVATGEHSGRIDELSAASSGSPPSRATFEVADPLPLRSRRSPRWIALGVVAVCLGAIASFFLYSHLVQSEQVIGVRQTVHRGEVIAAADLGLVRVGDTGGVKTVPAEQLDDVIGKVAGFDLVQGSLLPAGAVTSTLPPDKGNGVIGIQLPVGRAPNGFLAAGSPVRLVVLPADAAVNGTSDDRGGGAAGGTVDSDVTDVGTIAAVVVNAQQGDNGVFINLELAADEATRAASYAAQNRIVVVRESER